MTADDIDGTFSMEVLPTVPNLVFDVIHNFQSVVLEVLAAARPGDYNGDGTVDAADYLVWRKNDGTQEGYDTWRTNFGATAAGAAAVVASGATGGAPSGSSAAVPEPTALLLLSFCLAALLAKRRVSPSMELRTCYDSALSNLGSHCHD